MANGGLFRVAEVVQMAIEEEHNGKLFYDALAKCAKSPVLKEAARRLAVQEEGHEKAFTALRDRLGLPAQNETYPGEYANYMNALMNGKTFPNEEAAVKLAQDAGGDVAAVSTAILFEKNTLLFLSEMKTLVSDRDAAMVDELIDEERQHLVDLSNLRTMLTV
ncbi:MAG TPA: ferritin family protein [Planctomycetota bacterium]|nr:ferritin family protein [Planctomycetota bacterium]HRR81579.1 ferritin family protein [Planctomycetota bacterium]HRT94868.1 ferritin family protein [Planctomycetota bacterium]